MRIKKKHVLLEALLIDTTNEFDATEKRIIKLLKVHYGDPLKEEEGKKSFSQWDVAAWLIESLEIPYEMAYELAKTYFWNYDLLFSESNIRKTIPTAELFHNNRNELTNKFINNLTDSLYGKIKINFDRDTGIEDIRDIHFWGSYRGLKLYIPFESTDQYGETIYGSQRNDRLLLIEVFFNPMDKNGNIVNQYISDGDYKEKIDNEKFKAGVSYSLGDVSQRHLDENNFNLMEFDVPYPKSLSLKTYSEMIEQILSTIIKKIESITIELPPHLKGFGTVPETPNEDSQLD